MARIGHRQITTYRFAEIYVQGKKWIFPDVGFVDFGRSDYHELFTGFGRNLFTTPRAALLGEFYFVQATGGAAGSASYAQPWFLFTTNLAAHVRGEVVYFPYFPVHGDAYVHHVLERSKIEYAATRYKVGAGYAGSSTRDGSWVQRPFVTATAKTVVGDIEFWIQRAPPTGVRFEARYRRVMKKG